MAIPNNITKENLLSAISKIDTEGIPADGNSQYYDVVFNGKRYPPKLIVSYANLFANGEILDRKSFSGGLDTLCFKLLKQNEFTIVKKGESNIISFAEEIEKFLSQAQTENLKTSHYQKHYQEFNVKVSFGQGYKAKVPWISFLGEGQLTSNGIYPVYLLYENSRKLVLAFGVSETNKPSLDWKTEAPTLEKYFQENNIGDVRPYPNSFLFKIYDLNSELDHAEMDTDLSKIIEIYRHVLNDNETPIQMESTLSFNYKSFSDAAHHSNFFINEKLSLRFVASLLTKPFVILTGLSGSGKTKLAQAFAMWLSKQESQYCIVSVGADWTNKEPLIGFPNALKENDFVRSENKALDLIIDASNNLDKPYFLILDEMNLSHVERYFADFLSVMESKGKMSFHTGTKDWNGVPPQINFPNNLFIIGTVNIDETTYMFSPKVLDRANVIEFRITKSEMENYLTSHTSINLENLWRSGAAMANSFVDMATDKSAVVIDAKELNTSLINFFIELKKIGAEFGYRTASEIIRFSAIINNIEPSWTTSEIIDVAVMQKLLPKVHGSRRKLEPVLKTLGALCLQDGHDFEQILRSQDLDFTDLSRVKYPVSLEKIIRMIENLQSNGFTSYAEA